MANDGCQTVQESVDVKSKKVARLACDVEFVVFFIHAHFDWFETLRYDEQFFDDVFKVGIQKDDPVLKRVGNHDESVRIDNHVNGEVEVRFRMGFSRITSNELSGFIHQTHQLLVHSISGS